MPKRLSLGQYLEQVRVHTLDLTLKEARERAGRYRAEVGANTIRDIELERTLNPGILTVEAIALAYELPPLHVIAYGLSEPPEQDSNYQESRIALAWREYSRLPAKSKHKRIIDDYIETLIKRIAEASAEQE